ncbi:50S ribosomal protein L15e [Candidatus Woesearchaeota archaeon]|nr:50S ribosomal protein L15e [Candidatus Woesearchaeota archaeon]
MGIYQKIRGLWKKPKANLGELWKSKLMQFRREPVTVRLERPTKLDKARSLGYKAKQGIFVVRQRISRGSHTRPKRYGGRRSKHAGQRLTLRKNYRFIAEERAVKKYPNCEVLNSYEVAKDGKYYWFEIILVDKKHPAIVKDKNLGWISNKQHTRRVHRGKTSAGRKVRGLRHKGKGAVKARPSRRAKNRLQ